MTRTNSDFDNEYHDRCDAAQRQIMAWNKERKEREAMNVVSQYKALYRCRDCGARLVSSYEHKQSCYHCTGPMEYVGPVSEFLSECMLKF